MYTNNNVISPDIFSCEILESFSIVLLRGLLQSGLDKLLSIDEHNYFTLISYYPISLSLLIPAEYPGKPRKALPLEHLWQADFTGGLLYKDMCSLLTL